MFRHFEFGVDRGLRSSVSTQQDNVGQIGLCASCNRRLSEEGGDSSFSAHARKPIWLMVAWTEVHGHLLFGIPNAFVSFGIRHKVKRQSLKEWRKMMLVGDVE